MQREIADRRFPAAEAAAWIRRHAHGPEGCGKRVVNQQAAREAVANAGDLLEHFQSLQRAHDTGDGTEDTRLAAVGRSFAAAAVREKGSGSRDRLAAGSRRWPCRLRVGRRTR